MSFQPRWYQSAAVDATYRWLKANPGKNPVIVIPTGGGKTYTLSTICTDTVRKWSGRALVLSHSSELIKQTANTLAETSPDIEVGVVCSKLNQSEFGKPITCASIQSIYKRGLELGAVNVVLVDEAQLTPPDGDGMYRTLFADLQAANPHVRIIGLTATPYRLAHGSIVGDEGFFDGISFEVGVRELVVQGFLSPVVGKRTLDIDTSGLRIRGGDFAKEDADFLMWGVGEDAARELLTHAKSRSRCLVFLTSVEYGNAFAELLRAAGQTAAMVHGGTPQKERDEAVRRFRSGSLKYLVNVDLFTVGFDVPSVDCVALLRPTMSPGLYYQMVGRGFRIAPGKRDCLVLDFGGNIERHGPVDCLNPPEKQERRSGKKSESSGPAAKCCPDCFTLCHPGRSRCPECDKPFGISAAKHGGEASDLDPLSTDDGFGPDVPESEPAIEEVTVVDVGYAVHKKRGADDDAPRTMRVEYYYGPNAWVSEWICVEHRGHARAKAVKWWKARCQTFTCPQTAEEAVEIANSGKLREPTVVRVKRKANEKYPSLLSMDLGDYGEARSRESVSDALSGGQTGDKQKGLFEGGI